MTWYERQQMRGNMPSRSLVQRSAARSGCYGISSKSSSANTGPIFLLYFLFCTTLALLCLLLGNIPWRTRPDKTWFVYTPSHIWIGLPGLANDCSWGIVLYTPKYGMSLFFSHWCFWYLKWHSTSTNLQRLPYIYQETSPGLFQRA